MTKSRIIRDISELLPHVQELAKKWLELCNREGVSPKIVETYRTPERQAELMKVGGVTKALPMRSWHQWRRAWDAYPIIDGVVRVQYDAVTREAFHLMGSVAVSLGIEWGGNWKTLKDYAHFQVTDGLKIDDLAAIEKECGEH
jgi:peptidoglycan L-alanyl-D-glutamate endopeptidase CwlK